MRSFKIFLGKFDLSKDRMPASYDGQDSYRKLSDKIISKIFLYCASQCHRLLPEKFSCVSQGFSIS